MDGFNGQEHGNQQRDRNELHGLADRRSAVAHAAVEALTYRRSAWQADSRDRFSPAFCGDTIAMDALQSAVMLGEAELWDVLEGGEVIAGFVFRWDGMELELVAAVSEARGRKVAMETLPVCEEMAKSMGARGVVVNTYRTGLVRELAARGYRALHVKMWKEVEHGLR
jgi:GNAT superfamily N-acetyltransferase